MYKKALLESMKTNESYQINNSFDVFYVYNVQWSQKENKLFQKENKLFYWRLYKK